MQWCPGGIALTSETLPPTALLSLVISVTSSEIVHSHLQKYRSVHSVFRGAPVDVTGGRTQAELDKVLRKLAFVSSYFGAI